jgi:hypothetical protein
MTDAERPSRAEIARLAYRFFEMRGRQDGYDVDDWLSAERAAHASRAVVEAPTAGSCAFFWRDPRSGCARRASASRGD